MSRHTVDTIVIGADVTHPGNSATSGTPSIAAVVGSIDDNFMKFPGSMRLQSGRKEDMVDLAQMVKERLLAWARNHNDRLLENVLFYRDGVSESQYDIISRRELPQIQTAMNLAYLELKKSKGQSQSSNDPPGSLPALPSFEEQKMPRAQRLEREKAQEEDQGLQVETHKNNRPFKLTFVVVGKRHNARFYPVKDADMAKPSAFKPDTNVKPGLVVDQVITHPFRMDFYLQSHFPIQGTGRSAHYVVLRNNMGMSVTQLQEVTHTLCYVYARATKGVSYCAPAYYADHLCDRGRAYLRNFLVNKRLHALPPQKLNGQLQVSYNKIVKTFIENSRYYRPNQGGLNPWHTALNSMMFYL